MRELIEAFLEKGTLPEKLDEDFLQALREALAGLIKVVVKPEELRHRLTSGGSPATLEEMRKRFEQYLEELTRGKEASKVRIVIE